MATKHREWAAFVWNITFLRRYLERTRFTIRTDQEALQWVLTMAEAPRKLAEWHLRMSEFEFDTVHCTGIRHQTGEALSHLKTKEEDNSTLVDEVPVLILF